MSSLLSSCGHNYSLRSMVQSELRVIKTLQYRLMRPTPLVYVETLLAVLGSPLLYVVRRNMPRPKTVCTIEERKIDLPQTITSGVNLMGNLGEGDDDSACDPKVESLIHIIGHDKTSDTVEDKLYSTKK